MDKLDVFIRNLKKIFRSKGIITPLTASYEITPFCNLMCKHCYNRYKSTNHLDIELSYKKQIVSTLKQLGVLEVVLCGGEPFIDKDILNVIEHAKSLDLRLIILTNGLLITEEIIVYLKKILDKYDIIQFSIDDIIDDEESTQRNLTLEEKLIVLNNLKKLISIDINVIVNIVPTILNQHYIIKLGKKLIELGVKNIGATPYVPMGGKNADLIKPDYKLLADIHKYLDVYAKSKGINYSGGIEGHVCQSYVEYRKNNSLQQQNKRRVCDAAEFNIHVSYNGNLYPCVFMEKDEFLIGSISDPLEKIKIEMKKMNEKIKVELPSVCLSCELLPLCGGGCPGLIFDRYGTLQEVDPRCRRKNNATSDNC
ncbi:radical SAM additional 4Fe4S-binding SPASM domain-containing protein [Thermoanaerobacter thermohydrosulfuricus]|uniref:Radical SAM 4Fe4S-binding domain protein n=2 Tax=Thermoanaerobacter thermohydrosulfuricus TaxID=1516 RepID=M8CLB9_THETY|nr:radical SAM protein [Thermoanaerobacter thermohydrosulfuricus]EMT38020.1 radical SAM 4Fe4S-binding domain protein [Thermoanaerobacter thermohydrosulfuricus WC1]SDG41493.1 radical SAM additional 4Fe4S-binding SPASM domain-containing protein [Thermoanaerobacter thermohydrosulfuricus]SFE68503.1 radical SAM additional 4Fe4S-binding SPASM domain-containing protein [Thermoanaerobacter thermohydrosulfuricus]